MRAIDDFISNLAKDIRQVLDDDVELINAYPCVLKPTVLNNPVVTVGLDNVTLCEESLDSDEKSGEITVFADIFIPARADSARATEIFSSICGAANRMSLVSISAQRLSYDKLMSAYVMKASFSFNDIVIFGGEQRAGGISTGRGAQ